VELEVAKQNPPDSADDMSLLLADLRDRIQETSFDLQSISHQLHSSKLEYLGIVAAIKGFCNELSSAQNIEIDFSHDDLTSPISYEVSLALFRVLQEALHNAVRHSHVRHFEVKLNCSSSDIHLRVSDRGVGFDAATAMKKAGLGLISMQERIRAVNGTIAINSTPMAGTSIDVHIPFTSASDEARATG
jgi:signal transduction histidine kinase